MGNLNASIQDDFDSHRLYCEASGGAVEEMAVELSTKSGMVTGQSKLFCNFYTNKGFQAIGLETFSSDKPSIAATYIKKLKDISKNSPLWLGQYSNPATNVCKNLGGAAVEFITNGGFSNKLGQSGICVFGDGSMVSSWTLIYMANHREGYDAIKTAVKAEPLMIYLTH